MPKLCCHRLLPVAALLVTLLSAAQETDRGDKHGAAPTPPNIEALLAQNPLAPSENIKVIPLSKTEHSADFLVQVRDREPLHYHADSDIAVWILRGKGTLRIDNKTFAIQAGDTMHIPRGTPHAFINQGPNIGVAVVTYSPAPGPNDRVVIDRPP